MRENTQHPSQPPQSAAPAPATSTIRTLHARYEACWREYNVVDEADTALARDPRNDRSKFSLQGKYERAKQASSAESDALRLAILFQVPMNWVEAMILQFHISNAFDLVINAEAGPMRKQEQEAASVVIDTLLDFMGCEIEQDHEALGRQLQKALNNVFSMRRYRTGVLEA